MRGGKASHHLRLQALADHIGKEIQGCGMMPKKIVKQVTDEQDGLEEDGDDPGSPGRRILLPEQLEAEDHDCA